MSRRYHFMAKPVADGGCQGGCDVSMLFWRGPACFDETLAPLVDRAAMDRTTNDVTNHPPAQPSCWFAVLEPHLSRTMAAGTNGYEMLTPLGRRIQRVYRAA